jgi:vanillate/3-O-methylgallate O-demethylase
MNQFRFFVACILLAVWSSAMAIDEPAYTVVRSYDSFELAGMSLFSGYSYNERCILSLGLVDQDVRMGDVLTMVWGEPPGTSGLTSVEAHEQTTIRVRVSPTPYARQAREEYASGWRTSAS